MKKFFKKNGYVLANIALVVGFTFLFVDKMENENVALAHEAEIVSPSYDEIELEIFYMYSNKEGSYFLEPTAEFENVIFIDKQSMDNMHMGKNIHHGAKFIGVFDSTGWDLLGISDFRF